MSGLFKDSVITSIVALIVLLFHTSNSYSSVLPSSERATNTRNVSNLSKPMAGRNRRNIALRAARYAYPKAFKDQVRVSSKTNKLRINVLANDVGNGLKIKEVNKQSAKGGRVYLQGRSVVYLPKPNFYGWDSFWYAIVDENGRRHSAKVNVCLCEK